MLTEIEEVEALELLKAVITCNTVNPPGNELLLAQRLQALLAKEGIEAQVDEFLPQRANLIFTLEGKDKANTLLVTGHLDTVPAGEIPWKHDPFSAAIENGELYGRGASDMKGSIAAMLYAIIKNKRAGVELPQNLLFVGTAGEETFCTGAQHYVATQGIKQVTACLVGEPSNGELLIAHKGAAWLEVTTYGQTSHGSMPHLGINAVVAMNAFIEALTKQSFDIASDPVVGQPTFSINQIQGGVAINVVPDKCTCRIDMRTIAGQTKQDICSFVEKAMTSAKELFPQFKAAYKFECFLPPVACPVGHKILDALDAAAGAKLLRRGVNYFTDASVFVGESGMPVVIYGPGDDKLAHQPNERIKLTAYNKAIEVYSNFFKSYKI